ncbi:helix-turn-helix domain-containing protein [Hymenobacter wooponensis]|uniref:Helix-turn-helix domain-containing protein n=1 Tax=Hymenobacter wooponensis TaxID=1525360 RepID=A0A4Z0MIL7_9BACT|nr:helix-turn-helix domain-containing protein [Hymenobacter wooponensis]
MVERIREILSRYQLTPTQFADAIGTARPIVSHILSGRNKPSLEVVQKISAAYPDISLPWLMFGTGPMEATAVSSQSTAEVTSSRPNKATEKPAAERVTSKPPSATSQSTPAPIAASRPVQVVATITDDQPTLISNELAAEEATLPPTNNNKPTVAPNPTPAPVAEPPKALGAASPQTSVPSAFQAFAEPGKAIRRIVIFYSDGTFTDYQPEAPTA